MLVCIHSCMCPDQGSNPWHNGTVLQPTEQPGPILATFLQFNKQRQVLTFWLMWKNSQAALTKLPENWAPGKPCPSLVASTWLLRQADEMENAMRTILKASYRFWQTHEAPMERGSNLWGTGWGRRTIGTRGGAVKINPCLLHRDRGSPTNHQTLGPHFKPWERKPGRVVTRRCLPLHGVSSLVSWRKWTRSKQRNESLNFSWGSQK